MITGASQAEVALTMVPADGKFTSAIVMDTCAAPAEEPSSYFFKFCADPCCIYHGSVHRAGPKMIRPAPQL